MRRAAQAICSPFTQSFTPNNISDETENKLFFFRGETWTAAHSANTPGLPNFSPWGNERFVSQSVKNENAKAPLGVGAKNLNVA